MEYRFCGRSIKKVQAADTIPISRYCRQSCRPGMRGGSGASNIDLPYNSGNESWVYNDNVNDPKIRKRLGEAVGKEGGDLLCHDKWPCMIRPRLKLLKKLLADGQCH